MEYSSLNEFITYASFSMFLILCRSGAIIMLFPGIGEYYVSARIRMMFALLFSSLMAPLLQDIMPQLPGHLVELVIIIISEIFIGLFIGILVRILLAATHISGMIIATQSALSAATLFDANQGAQGAIIGNFFSAILIVLIFSTNMHHLLITGIYDTYSLFIPGEFMIKGMVDSNSNVAISNIADMTHIIVHTVGETFKLSLKIASPIVVVGLLMFLVGGILARLMPSMQIFFIITPIQMLLSFFIILAVLGVSMNHYLEHITQTMIGIFNFDY